MLDIIHIEVAEFAVYDMIVEFGVVKYVFFFYCWGL